MKISIIIVNFNVKFFLEQCLYSVLNACKNLETEIFVVDNNSTDGSSNFFEHRFQEVIFIWNKENAGFSKANNQALKMATGEFILFLNPDTILPEDCLEKCLYFFEIQNNAGALGIRMIDGSGTYLKESKRAFPSPATSLFKLTGLTALFPSSKTFARYYLGHLDSNNNHEVDVLAGAFMLIKKSVLETTGGFDERFFMYGEDIDLSYRIQKAGFKNIYFSGTTLLHFKGESTKRGSLNYIRLFYGAMGLFVKKHYSKGIAGFYNMLIHVVIWIRAIFGTIEHLLTQLYPKTNVPLLRKKYIIIGDKYEFDFIMAVLNKNNIQPVASERISPNYLLEEDTIGNLTVIPDLITKKVGEEIIFCINSSLTAKETILILQDLPQGLTAWFHFKHSISIIGSKHKTSSGDCLS